MYVIHKGRGLFSVSQGTFFLLSCLFLNRESIFMGTLSFSSMLGGRVVRLYSEDSVLIWRAELSPLLCYTIQLLFNCGRISERFLFFIFFRLKSLFPSPVVCSCCIPRFLMTVFLLFWFLFMIDESS